jgi:hypothetical protein
MPSKSGTLLLSLISFATILTIFLHVQNVRASGCACASHCGCWVPFTLHSHDIFLSLLGNSLAVFTLPLLTTFFSCFQERILTTHLPDVQEGHFLGCAYARRIWHSTQLSSSYRSSLGFWELLHTTRFSRAGGTGLGLCICQSLVARMGGRIWLRSIVNEGTSFFFTMRLGIPSDGLDSNGVSRRFLDGRKGLHASSL